jgi:hypothetical protein
VKLTYFELRYETGRKAGKLFRWFVWHLPKRLVYQCAIRVIAHATTGQYANQIVPDLTAMDALERWDKR